jgi:Tfp pilus assembly protein PilP
MRLSRLALALTLVLTASPAAVAGRGKPSRAHSARKADVAKTRSPRVAPETTLAPKAGCRSVVLGGVSLKKLRLVGIVSQGSTQVALLMDAADRAITITPGECVGVERVPYDDVVKPLREKLANPS